MTDRFDPGGGGLTGATGDLTPDDATEPFEPAERREVDDPDDRGRVTYDQSTRDSSASDARAEPGWGPDTGDSTDAPRDAGYGSTHGLSADDDAYRVERHAPPSAAAEPGRRESGAVRIGGDETIDAEQDRF